MSGKLPSKYQVGDTVWHARCDWSPVEQPCPICFGNREVMLTLGNGDEMMLPCNYCAPGFEAPKGVVAQYEHIVAPEPVTITGVEIKCNGGVVKSYYRNGCFGYDEDRLYEFKEDAAKRGLALKAELDHDQNTRVDNLKKSKAKSFSWNAGYHMREAKRDRASAERHEQKAVLCKARAKTPSDGASRCD